MSPMDDYLAVNRANWDERAPAHAASVDYGVERFVADPAHLSAVVRHDLPLLGDVGGLTGIHLQCHIGTDTLSLARLGARMTGLDLSPASLAEARRLATAAGPHVDYVEADTYSAPQALGGGPSTSSTPGSGRCAGCPTSTGGPPSSTSCSRRAGGSSCARDTRCCGRWTSAAPTR